MSKPDTTETNPNFEEERVSEDTILDKIKAKIPKLQEEGNKKKIQNLSFLIGSIFIMYKILFSDGESPQKPQKKKQKTTISTVKGDEVIEIAEKNKEKIEVNKNLEKEIKTFIEPVKNTNITIEYPTFDANLAIPERPKETIRQKKAGDSLESVLAGEGLIRPNLEKRNKVEAQAEYSDDPIVAALSKMETGPSSISQNSQSQSEGRDDYILFNENYVSKRKHNNTSSAISRLQDPETTIQSNSIIDAVLANAINSEKPGYVTAIVVSDVYGQLGDKVLIAKGSKVIGTYTTTVAEGETRIGIIWSKIQRPDGINISVNAYAADQLGQTGIEADVDEKYGKALENSVLLSMLTLGSAVASERLLGTQTGQTNITSSTVTATTNITPVNSAVNSVITTASDIAKKMAERYSKVMPTLSVPHGTAIKIIVNDTIEGIPPM